MALKPACDEVMPSFKPVTLTPLVQSFAVVPENSVLTGYTVATPEVAHVAWTMQAPQAALLPACMHSKEREGESYMRAWPRRLDPACMGVSGKAGLDMI